MSAFGTLQAASALSYLIALVIPALDAIFPVLPGETVVIALGVATAGSTDPRIALLVTCGLLAIIIAVLQWQEMVRFLSRNFILLRIISITSARP